MPSERPNPRPTHAATLPMRPAGTGRRQHRRWIGIGVAVFAGIALVALLSVDFRANPHQRSNPPLGPASALARTTPPKAAPEAHDSLTVRQLLALSDEDLSRLDPLLVNLIVAREIPGLESLDVPRYSAVVDDWAARISRGLAAAEPMEAGSELYKRDPDLWRMGSMAIALAGPSFGVTYTKDTPRPSQPAQLFVHGAIDTKVGTCSNLPVLYLALAHRLDWPLKAVVSRDHMWCRWDDGKPDGKRFNIEATNAASDGDTGSFSSETDEQYAQSLRTSKLAIDCGSDLTSLTPRQTLGVYLQTRAA